MTKSPRKSVPDVGIELRAASCQADTLPLALLRPVAKGKETQTIKTRHLGAGSLNPFYVYITLTLRSAVFHTHTSDRIWTA